MVCKAETDFSWLTDGETGDKNFSEKIEKYTIEFSSVYKIAISVVLSIAAVSIIIVGLKFVTTKNGIERKELQDKLWVIILVICIILGTGTVFTIAYQIGTSITLITPISLFV